MFIVIGQFCCGKGDTEAKAAANARRAGSASQISTRLVYSIRDAEAFVDDAGNLCWHGDEPEDRPVLLKKINGKKIEVIAAEPLT